MGTIVATKDVEKDGTSWDGNTAIGGEPGADEISGGGSGGVREYGVHRETMLVML